MSLLQHQLKPEAEEPSRTGRFVLIGLIVIGCGVAAYFSMPPPEEPAPVTATADPPSPPPSDPEPDPIAAAPVAEPAPELDVVAEAAPPSARLEPLLRVASDIPGASVFLDRRYLGTTPFELSEVSPGPHRLNVSAEGYEGFARNIELGNEPVSIDVRFLEIRLSASVAVTHKHRFGSCAGMLRADLDGIRYETTDDDAFSISLTAVEQHEMDYLERSLTLKRREGRTYNFTVEQDTVDALFVFHSDVERTRERLAGSPR